MANARSAPVAFATGSDPRFADEENGLLLVRLRAASILLSAGLAMLLLRDLALGGGPSWQFQAAATVAMALLATLLSAVRSAPSRGLRAAEAAAFALAASASAVRLWHAQLSA